MKNIIVLLLFSLYWVQAHAIELNPVGLLNKMSMTLTGRPAATSDQITISKMTDESARNSFLDQKINEYMKTAEYTAKVTFKLYELFQFKNPESVKYKVDFLAKPIAYSTNLLFNSLSESNLSWDTILLSKKYTLTGNYPQSEFEARSSDFGFFGSVMDLPNNGDGSADLTKYTESVIPSRNIEFDQDDLRIAGALTTPTFFARYATTGINKNRRRAAAIFRIFLCDSMTAAIPAAVGIDNALFDILFPQSAATAENASGMTESEVKAILNKSDLIHGNRTDCKSCHYKLDPMGKVFATSPASLGSMPSSGALAYKDSAGKIINVPVNGIGEMAETLTKQNDYVKCQINHFWKWYIGEDIALSDQRMVELQQTFENVHRRTNDFTKSLLLSKEFSIRELPNELRDLAKGVKGFLQRCQSCHKNSADYAGADLTKWPMGQNQSDPKDNNRYWISKLSETLDLTHHGFKPTMPPAPKDGGFIPSKQELDMITTWISSGAPDETGTPQQAVQP